MMAKTGGDKMPRALSVIAREIRDNWEAPNYAAAPYLAAMSRLSKITDKYIADDACEIVMYFLSNATTWRGDVARRVKNELNAILAEIPRG
jgi:hypothetical protein